MYGPVSIQLGQGSRRAGDRFPPSPPEEREFLREQGADKVVVTDEQDLVLEVERLHRGQGRQCHPRRIGQPQMTLCSAMSPPPRQAGAVWLQRRQRVGVPGLRRVQEAPAVLPPLPGWISPVIRRWAWKRKRRVGEQGPRAHRQTGPAIACSGRWSTGYSVRPGGRGATRYMETCRSAAGW